jgi:hypothetical protein
MEINEDDLLRILSDKNDQIDSMRKALEEIARIQPKPNVDHAIAIAKRELEKWREAITC